MKICMLLPFAVFGTYGGMQSHVYALSEQIALMGHDVFLIGENIGANKFEIINGVKRIGIKTDPSAYANYFANSYALMNISRHVEKINRKEKFDVFHAHGAGGALMALKSRSASNKLIITSHGLPPSYLTKNYSIYNFNFKDDLKKCEILFDGSVARFNLPMHKQLCNHKMRRCFQRCMFVLPRV